jgi:anti-sigma B factor antagonist
MTNAKVTMSVRELNSGASIVDILGDVSGQAENQLMDAYTQASSNGARIIVLNFSDLAYMNSSGIGLLVTLLIRARRQGQQLMAYGLSTHYQEIFRVTRLDEAIGIYPTEQDALAAATVISR